ncbi:hypothetical protein CBR_g31994 [Chara braunii]|uniref:Uncharacterized protein n=1 Tax=Chara braunii TaxID=69332 RepID=A0A388LG93_CHABU|nr:hypothetical protein CBR_g31994 [Chara braunii]|eukprot:GBG81319.1 hypothetical protein CBR_g31994 [Chara braunii]
MGGESGYVVRQQKRESASVVACAHVSIVKAAAAWSSSRSAARSAMDLHDQAIGIFEGFSLSRDDARATSSRSSSGRCRQRLAGGGGRRPGCRSTGRRFSIRAATKGDRSSSSDSPNEEATPLVKAAWYASEAFGKAVALVRGPNKEREDEDWEEEEEGRLSREEAIAALRADYNRSYFVTGKMSMGIYEEDCEFADPFVSFKGRQRFKQNVSNLGSFMREVNLTVVDWQEAEDKLTTKWRFSCVLALPWRPILAASGGTDHYFDKETGKIYKHVERWDISPADGVRQLFKPNPKLRKKGGNSSD